MKKTSPNAVLGLLLLTLTALPACTKTELTNASAASARNWCHHTPEKCTVDPAQK